MFWKLNIVSITKWIFHQKFFVGIEWKLLEKLKLIMCHTSILISILHDNEIHLFYFQKATDILKNSPTTFCFVRHTKKDSKIITKSPHEFIYKKASKMINDTKRHVSWMEPLFALANIFLELCARIFITFSKSKYLFVIII